MDRPLTQVAGQVPAPCGAGTALYQPRHAAVVSLLGRRYAETGAGWIQRGQADSARLATGVSVMAGALALGADAGAAWWILWCVTTSVITLVQPAVAQAFPVAAVGRALSAFNW